MEVNDGSNFDFGFVFNDSKFSDRVLRIEIEHDHNELCNMNSDIEVKNIHICSLIFAARSPFFFKLFSNGMKESEERHATLRIHSSLMDLLKFMYSNTLLSATISSLLDVLMVADKFEVSSCMKYCSHLLLNSMACDSALQILDLPASVMMADEVQPLTDAARKYLDGLYKDSTKFEDEVLKLPLTRFEVVLSSDKLRVASEDVVYDLVLNWTRKNYPIIDKRLEILTRLTSLIRYEYMTCRKLKEILAYKDLDPAYASRFVLDALFFKAESHDLHTSPRFVERAYTCRQVKVLESKFPHPHYIVYLELKKEECTNLLPSNRIDFELPVSNAQHSTTAVALRLLCVVLWYAVEGMSLMFCFFCVFSNFQAIKLVCGQGQSKSHAYRRAWIWFEIRIVLESINCSRLDLFHRWGSLS